MRVSFEATARPLRVSRDMFIAASARDLHRPGDRCRCILEFSGTSQLASRKELDMSAPHDPTSDKPAFRELNMEELDTIVGGAGLVVPDPHQFDKVAGRVMGRAHVQFLS